MAAPAEATSINATLTEKVSTPQIINNRPNAAVIIKSLFAGGVAGGLSRTAVAPLERLKILMQVQGNEKIYRGVWQGLVHMAKTEGVKGMMKGNLTNCIRIVPNSAVKFFTYEQLSREISEYRAATTGSGELTPLIRLGTGAIAGIIAMSSTYPLDMVRGRLTIQEGRNKQYNGIWHATRTILKEEGPLAFYKGWLPSVIGVIPYVGLNFAVYETLKAYLMKENNIKDERELSIVSRLGCGAVAGSTGQTVAYPFDVARRRLQVSGWQGAKELHSESGHVVAYRGMTDCFVRTVREEGFSALFKGLWPNYLKVVPSIAIAFVCYEQVKEILGVEFKISE
uniref:Mitochondrial carrier protein n=1 Tax=Polytomella parva TaxID=51329 RepID=A0A7S0YN92_9CHLO|nr:mitochondrial carrier protein (MITC10) [Polytomella parva]|mmetsp:Transcript_34217/g.61709  ORF Transcript_34217/g.61709 Transcript_34217/m.61709 type:complete len:339 (+) Transcript_34217:130-1146(+)|eukprot:CAMPEP_0175043488 /NCGR_PEP_ID=MMETSP0052_2-20121109/3220_1 /TAXON_ID=51329 ORGANISM="Polytomella parva, Strain SAG 63-3" /NCGR_SAMPLE_ID=MMETSP0052_2 /ASSEMBLY_ACC=CAM_ASM_000194 /LENGTH=338 /DNA_ID=CAMNT_0016306563 /DNA_START=53 /DNA_END=1069 /DNA_ORIENTATION=-